MEKLENKAQIKSSEKVFQTCCSQSTLQFYNLRTWSIPVFEISLFFKIQFSSLCPIKKISFNYLNCQFIIFWGMSFIFNTFLLHCQSYLTSANIHSQEPLIQLGPKIVVFNVGSLFTEPIQSLTIQRDLIDLRKHNKEAKRLLFNPISYQ